MKVCEVCPRRQKILGTALLYISIIYCYFFVPCSTWPIQMLCSCPWSCVTGFAGGGSILPSNANLPPQHCYQSPTVSLGQVSGSVCDANVRFRRMAWNKPLPTSLLYRDALLTNEHGTSRIPWRFMRLTHNQGWMATVILGQNYNFTFDNAPQLTNISYRCFTKTSIALLALCLVFFPNQIRLNKVPRVVFVSLFFTHSSYFWKVTVSCYR